jgi:hypothetical protein
MNKNVKLSDVRRVSNDFSLSKVILPICHASPPPHFFFLNGFNTLSKSNIFFLFLVVYYRDLFKKNFQLYKTDAVYWVLFQSKSLLNDPLKFDAIGGTKEAYNVTGLQPDTKYSIQVAALTRKGDGDRSVPVIVRTPGGVPNRPTVNLK